MSLYLGYHAYPGLVKGVIALSCYCFPLEIPPDRKQIPGLIMHGDADPMIAMSFAQDTYNRSLQGVNYTFKAVPGLEHWISFPEMVEVKEWIQAHVEE